MSKRLTLLEARRKYPNLIILHFDSTRECIIKCPRCRKAVKRSIFAASAQKIPGRCLDCTIKEKVSLTLEKAKDISPLALATRVRRLGVEILTTCPAKTSPGCKYPSVSRWVWGQSFKRNKGVCRSCCQFKSGLSVDQQGYIKLYIGSRISSNTGRKIPIFKSQHRVVMEEKLNRKLREGETVHHINGKRNDNRIENLELRMSGNHPSGWSLKQMRGYMASVPWELGGLKK